MRRTLAVLSLAAALVALPATLAFGGGRPLSTPMSGANEVPGPGDPDGSGFAQVTLNQGRGEVCYSIEVNGIDTPTAAHIHVGTEDVAGPVVIPLPIVGVSEGCVEADRDLIKAIRQNPAGYYVNVHNVAFPGGAVRGQLSK